LAAISFVTLWDFIVRGSITTTPGAGRVIAAPIELKISVIRLTSSISGRFSILQGSSAIIDAHIIGSAAFFAPLTVTLPRSGIPPRISKKAI
jgi:hypothetical protein